MKRNIFPCYSLLVFLFVCLSISSCQLQDKETGEQTIGSIERYDAEMDQVIPGGAVIHILAHGFEWSEGPLWISEGNYLIFSDIPPNRIYKWSMEDSISIYLEPSGYTGDQPRKGEPGSNGLLLDPAGALILCQHGDRRVARMEAPLSDPQPVYITLAGLYDDKRLNSPNDACYHSNGDMYFTDPPYGLEGNVDDPGKELDFQGVYKLSPDGSLQLLTKDLSRPNGIALSPDEKTIYVANSDPERAIWMAYDVQSDGSIANGRLFYDATDWVGKEKGLPDGLKVNNNGYLFATGPGGVWIFNPDGKHLGMIKTTQATANCAFNEEESVLYITADMYLLCVDLKHAE
jgi:gluconolactonase